jgi:hypothetical protein
MRLQSCRKKRKLSPQTRIFFDEAIFSGADLVNWEEGMEEASILRRAVKKETLILNRYSLKMQDALVMQI